MDFMGVWIKTTLYRDGFFSLEWSELNNIIKITNRVPLVILVLGGGGKVEIFVHLEVYLNFLVGLWVD